MRKVSEINTLAELAGLRGVWAALLKQTPDATWFQSLEWLETYWQFYGEAQRLRVILVEDNGRPIGILPLVVTTESRRVGPVKVLTYPLHGWGSFYGPIGPDPAVTMQAGLTHIQQTPHDWDLIDLRWIDTKGSDGGATSQALQTAGFNHGARLWHTSAQIELRRAWEHYWLTRKPHWRSNVRRCHRRLLRRGELEHVRYRPLGNWHEITSPQAPRPLRERLGEGHKNREVISCQFLGALHADADPRWDLYDACVEIARRSWQGRSNTGTTLSHDSVRDYLRATHAAAAEAGAVDMNLLLLDGEPVAFAYNYHFQGSVYGLRSGFDGTITHEGAGTVLTAQMIEDSFRRGDRLIDLGPDYLDCKRYWLTRLRPAYHCTHYRSSALRAQVLRFKDAVNRWLHHTNPTRQQGKTRDPAPAGASG